MGIQVRLICGNENRLSQINLPELGFSVVSTQRIHRMKSPSLPLVSMQQNYHLVLRQHKFFFYIPTPKSRGFTAIFGKVCLFRQAGGVKGNVIQLISCY